MKTSHPKTLRDKINEATRGLKCPIHQKQPVIAIELTEKATAKVECCCNSFKTDVTIIVERVLRAWNLHGEHLRARRNERG
jgi:hypothetical protein